jgi:long-chain fatty acid transport protein
MQPRLAMVAAAIALVAGTGEVAANPTNYQPYVIGERSLGMAGAYAAAVDDSMALYYNPGALGFAGTTAVSASKSVYAAGYRRITDGFVPAFEEEYSLKNLDTTNDLTWPSTLTFITSFRKHKKKGFSPRHTIGFAMLVPFQENYSYRVKHKQPGIADNQTFYLAESYRTLWTGGGYGFRPTRKWGFGLSAFFSNYRYSRRFDSNWFDVPEDLSLCAETGCGETDFVESILKIKVNSVVIRVGALYRPTSQWRIGLTATAPSILLRPISEGWLDQTKGISSTSDPTDVHSRMYTDDYKLAVAGFRPASIRLGAAFIIPKAFTVDLDGTFHFPMSYRQIEGDAVADRLEDEPEASPEWFDPGIVRWIEHQPMANVNLGAEFLFSHGWTVRTGLFSDFSSAPEVVASDVPQLTQVHRIGGTFSIGHRGRDHDITVGVIGTYGSGHASVYYPEEARSPGEAAFQPTAYTDRAIYVFVGGAQKAVQDKARELWQKIVE